MLAESFGFLGFLDECWSSSLSDDSWGDCRYIYLLDLRCDGNDTRVADEGKFQCYKSHGTISQNDAEHGETRS